MAGRGMVCPCEFVRFAKRWWRVQPVPVSRSPRWCCSSHGLLVRHTWGHLQWFSLHVSLSAEHSLGALPHSIPKTLPDGYSATQMLFIHSFVTLEGTIPGKNRMRHVCSPLKEKEEGLSEFPTRAFLRLRWLSQAVASHLKDSSWFFFYQKASA